MNGPFINTSKVGKIDRLIKDLGKIPPVKVAPLPKLFKSKEHEPVKTPAIDKFIKSCIK